MAGEMNRSCTAVGTGRERCAALTVAEEAVHGAVPGTRCSAALAAAGGPARGGTGHAAGTDCVATLAVADEATRGCVGTSAGHTAGRGDGRGAVAGASSDPTCSRAGCLVRYILTRHQTNYAYFRYPEVKRIMMCMSSFCHVSTAMCSLLSD